MTLSIREIIDRKRPAEDSVPIVLDGDLMAEYERLSVELRDAGPAANFGDDSSADAIKARMEALRARMLDSRVFFRLRALPGPQWSPYVAALPVKQDDQTDEEAAEAYHRWLCTVVAASCVDPAMTADEAHELYTVLSNGEWGQLAGRAYHLQTTRQDIPFSEAASVLSQISGTKSRRPEPSASDAPPSLADSAEPSPSTNTTTATG